MVTTTLLILSTAFWGTLVFLGGIVKLLVPKRESRRNLRMFMAELGDRWAGTNNAILDRMLTTRWDVSGLEGLRIDAHYLIVSNHVSGVDIFALFRVFHRRAPFIRFFLKRQLIWFPVVGQACWALDVPFMRRHTAEYLAMHPEKRGRDLETTKIACRRYKRIPVSILNFLEGTRFTWEKHGDQESPYRHLLRPRVGGIAFVLASLGEQIDSIIDVTIAYPGSRVTMWDFVTNRIERIAVHVRKLDIPAGFVTGDITEPGPARDDFKKWVEQLWREKDETLGQMMYRGTLVP